MAPLEQKEIDELSTQVLQELSTTPYACNALTQLSGGTTNFVFRGILTQPILLQDHEGIATTMPAQNSVIIKRSTGFTSVNRDFLLDSSRCMFEQAMLNPLETFRPTLNSNQHSVQTPHLYYFNSDTNTQVHEDFPSTIDLRSIIISTNPEKLLSQPLATSIGRNVGAWTRSFYAWASASEQAGLQAQISKNEPMRKLKYRLTYDSVIPALEKFPEILDGHRKTFEEVKDVAERGLKRPAGEEIGEEWGIIHGDFWMGNVLAPDTHLLDLKNPRDTKLIIIDWEMAQLGHRAYDLGQLIGDLYERKHFKNAESAMWILEGFLDGYGPLSDDLAFRTAIHTGIHLICYCNRRPPHGAAEGSQEQIEGVVRLGRDFFLKGWEREREWFEGSVLASLFKKG